MYKHLPSLRIFYYLETKNEKIASSDEKERNERALKLVRSCVRFILGAASLAGAENFESFISAAIKQREEGGEEKSRGV